MSEIEIMLMIQKKTNKSVLLEASLHPTEWLVTLGWHHRGLWMRDAQTKGDTAMEALHNMAVEREAYD